MTKFVTVFESIKKNEYPNRISIMYTSSNNLHFFRIEKLVFMNSPNQATVTVL